MMIKILVMLSLLLKLVAQEELRPIVGSCDVSRLALFGRRRRGVPRNTLANDVVCNDTVRDPTPVNESDLVFPVKNDVPTELSGFFSHYVQVFGVHIFASRTSEDWFLQHVARGMAKYLDQDEDGSPDHPEVVEQMVRHKAAMVLTKTEKEYEHGIATIADKIHTTLDNGVIKNDHPIWNCSVTDVWVVAEEFEEETPHDSSKPYGKVPPGPPWGRDDALWEEVFHLISHVGYGCAWPEVWGFRASAAHPDAYPSDTPASNLSRALDNMMGNCGAAYNHTQTKKHKGCDYYYDDTSCFYPCLINEYLNTVHLQAIGARDYDCSGMEKEYTFCTQELSKEHDPMGSSLGAHHSLPQQVPSGHYAPKNSTLVFSNAFAVTMHDDLAATFV